MPDVLGHVPDQQQLNLEIGRTLKANGIAIVTTPNPLWEFSEAEDRLTGMT